MHWQHDFEIAGNLVGVLSGIAVDASGKGIEILTKLRALCCIPLLCVISESHHSDHLIRAYIACAPVFGSSAASLPVETEQQISMAFHLGPSKGVEKTGIIICID